MAVLILATDPKRARLENLLAKAKAEKAEARSKRIENHLVSEGKYALQMLGLSDFNMI